MARVKRGVTTHARHKKIVDMGSGYFGRSSTNYRIALERTMAIAAGRLGAPVFGPPCAQLVRGVRQLMRRGVRVGTVGGRHHRGRSGRKFVLLSKVEIMPSKAQKYVRSRPTGGDLE